MDIVTIYALPDVQEPLKAFEGLIKSFKKYGFRTCDKLKLIVPRLGVEKVDQIRKMVNLISGDGHEVIVSAYGTFRGNGTSESLIAYHNRVLCSASKQIVGVGKFLYIPFGCEPNVKDWARDVESLINMNTDKKFIGETRENVDGLSFLSGACVLDYKWFSSATVFQAIYAKNYALDRCARQMQGGMLSYQLPFTSVELGGKEEVLGNAAITVKNKAKKAAERVEELAKDVEDDVVDEVVVAVEEIVAPEPVVEVVVEKEFLADAIVETSEVKLDDTPKKVVEPPKRGRPAGKKAAKKKRGKKKTAKKVAKKETTSIEAPKSVSVPFGASLPRNKDTTERVDHSL
jgi:flagellar hook-basal body complex protein FliE